MHPTITPDASGTARLLADAYGFQATLERIPAGQVTVNYRASTAGGRGLFVKQYLKGADLTAEAAAIEQTRAASNQGVPVAPLVPAQSGAVIAQDGDVALSVWHWMPGRTVEDGLTPPQQAAAGEVLGRIHRTFAAHPASSRPSAKLNRWMRPDLPQLHRTIDQLLGIIDSRTEHDTFDDHAARTLTERRTMLQRVPGLIDTLPPLSSQVLHGDYSAVNLLLNGDTITAVLDFRPPESFLIAYELGRIAFDPRAVVLSDDPVSTGVALVAAYLSEHRTLTAADVRMCARIAALQLIISLYGIKQHYLSPGLIQADLDDFWLLRHKAAAILLNHLEDFEKALAGTADRARIS
ncbi:phosphotransferase [Streptomyces sodiiphilus]|uniref:Phosphotransferase n=1 Tax=Streptomyces sodiiphilus TaxID=226217 RepID=A0ABP5A4Q9_9ACTN